MAPHTAQFSASTDAPGPNPLSSASSTESTLSESLIVIKKRRLVLVLAVLLALAYGLYKAYTQPRIFESSAKIEVRSGSAQEFKVDPVQALGSDGGSNKMAAEVVILQSDSLMLTVARELNLANNPDFLGGRKPASFQSLDNLTTREATLKRLHSELKVQLVPKTDIIRLSYASLNANLSAEIVNRVVADYIQRSYETRYLSTQRVSQWLSGQLDDLKRQVETSQEQMLDLQRKLGMLGFDPTKNQTATTLEDLSAAVAQARIQRILAESRYREMSAMDPNTIEDSLDSSRGTTPPALTQLRTSIATAKATLADLQATLGPNHPQVKAQRAQLEAFQKEQDSEQNRLLAQAKENFVIAKASEERILQSLDAQKAEAYKMRDDLVEYTLRQREFESNRTLYEGLLQRLRTAGVEAGLESLEIDIVDPAVPAAAPTLRPKTTIVLTALVVGATLGILLIFILDSLDTGIRSIADIESITQLPSLAIVPRVRRPGAEAPPNATMAQRSLETITSPKSQFSEAIRSLRTSLLLSVTGRAPRYILFTSATPAEGKTTISTNSAVVLAQGGTRVLLIDADMRRPAVHPRFGLSGKVGLSTLLTGGSTLDETVQRVPEVPSLDIIASGPVPPFPAELLGSDAMRSMLATAAATYAYIVIDSPPILSVTDGVILARDADAVVLVVRHGKSSKHIIRRARDLLIRAGAPITGIVLNAVDLNSPEYQGYYGKSGYHYAGSDSEAWEPAGPEGKGKQVTRMPIRISCLRFAFRAPQSGARSVSLAIALAASCLPATAQFSGPGVSTANPNQNSNAVTTDPAILRPANQSIYINPGDLVSVHIFGSGDYQPTARVTLDNTLQLPLIGVVSVRGLTVDEAANLIADRLKSAGMYKDPQVSVQVLESTNGVITVSGEAHGVVPASSERRLLEVLAAAGGLPVTASHTIVIDRPGVEQPIVVDLGSDPMRSKQINLPLYPGDTVIVSRVGVVYMLGEFKIAGVIPIQQNSPLTLLQATAVAGGTLFDGKYQDLRIIRTAESKRSLVHVDIKRVMLGKDPDPLLQADDIVYLPNSAIKSAIVSGGINLLVNVANLALIASHY